MVAVTARGEVRRTGRRGAAYLLVCALLALIAAASEASAQGNLRRDMAAGGGKRVALVVGMSSYQFIPALDNPRNDAKLMAETLRNLGFTLVGDGAQLDLDKPAFDRAIQDFGQQLPGADVALFYYAGHGLQVRGANWLVPTTANPTRETDIDFQMVDANLVLRQMEGAGTRLNLMILDACRNNPFGGRGLRATSGGLAQMQAPEGTLISYATQPGNVAQDGADGNSPYTKALAQTLKRPGLDVFKLFNEVGLQVKRVTAGTQQPWVSNSPIDGDFYFVAVPSGSTATVLPPDAAPAADAEVVFWQSIATSTNPADYQAYLRQYPSGRFTELARARSAAPVTPVPQQLVMAVPPPQQVKPPSTVGGSPAGVGQSFRDCADCPEMVVVPAGSFNMGDRELPNSQPVHEVSVRSPFAVGKYDVTFDEWDACARDGGCRAGADDQGWGRGRRPAIGVSWDDAKAFAAWLSRKTGRSYRLLTEAEWEYAARAGTTTAYYWGADIGRGNANCGGCGSQWDKRQTAPVGSFAPNAFGLYDMLGNVWQWTEDCWVGNYANAPRDSSIMPASGACGRRVARGASWSSVPLLVRVGNRARDFTSLQEPRVGFRMTRIL